MPHRDDPADPADLVNALRVPLVTETSPPSESKLPKPSGDLKVTPEDFRVTEIPAYETCGHGEHLFLEIEKRDLPHERMVGLLADVLEIKKSDVGTAGMKDRRAVTRQSVSVPADAEDRLEHLARLELDEGQRLTLLGRDRHTNKLKTGHLRGNHFEIVARLTETPGNWKESLAAAAEVVARVGFPNAFGPQRFGDRGSTLALGLNLFRGDADVRDIAPRRRKFLSRLAISAAQSAVFNKTLATRMLDGTFATVLAGDVLRKRPAGAVFVADDPAREQPRVDAGELAVTGPMPGRAKPTPTGRPAEIERAALDAFGLTPEMLAKFPKLAPGARRPLTVVPDDLHVDPGDDAVRFTFALPAGCYATTLVNEFVWIDDQRGRDVFP